MLVNQIRPTTLSAAIVFRVHPFLAKKHRELPLLAIALKNILVDYTACLPYLVVTSSVCVFNNVVKLSSSRAHEEVVVVGGATPYG